MFKNALFILCLCLFTFSFAHADVIDPSQEACSQLNEGDSCSDSGNTCQTDECCRNDYSGEGAEPTVVCNPCLTCQPSSTGGAMTGGQASGGQAQGGAMDGGQTTGGEAGGNAGGEGSEKTTDPAESSDEGCASVSTSLSPFGILCGLLGLLMAMILRRSRI